jgi:AcrR family transcriptional regulator
VLMQATAVRPEMREVILDAVDRLLGRYGYQKMTMDDLAREAGISKRTIYLHFPGKEAVALASIDRVVDRLLDQLQAIACGDGLAGRAAAADAADARPVPLRQRARLLPEPG